MITLGQQTLSVDFGNTTANVLPVVNAVTTIALDAESYVDQIPVGLGTPMQITFGAAQTTAYADLTAGGLVTILQSGYYDLRLRVNIGRTGAGGVSIILARALVNGTQFGPSVIARIDSSADSKTTEFTFEGEFPASTTMLFQLQRDASGNNSGQLSTFNPTVAGWNDVPSADLLVRHWTRLEAV